MRGVDEIEREAAAALERALAQRYELHLPGARANQRARLEETLALCAAVLAADDVDAETRRRAQLTLVLAHEARALDARHGAGQLSRSAQRAPTSADCEDGWRNVAAIVGNAETSATEASAVAAQLGDARAEEAAAVARDAARRARQVLDERNHAYTFHADPTFSFGEGWYVAAAGLLAGVAIQIEREQAATPQAERFLRDAGLGPRLVPYRSRPRANKALPDEIARAFSADPEAARATLRAAFLGTAPAPDAVVDWARRALGDASPDAPKVLLWVRESTHQPERNSSAAELDALCDLVSESGCQPVLIGDAPPEGMRASPLDLTLFWKRPLFQGEDMRRAQLQLFENLRGAHGLLGQLGVTTAGMDGPALLGLPTLYLTDAPNPRMGRWVGAVPGYREILRRPGYLTEIEQALARWLEARR